MISERQIISFIPIEVVRNTGVTFDVQGLGIIISSENWPSNLIFNPDLHESDDMFYEVICSDTTLTFFITSAIGRCKSLVSRAVHEPNIIWEHGRINIIEIGGECSQTWMIRTRTNLALRKLND